MCTSGKDGSQCFGCLYHAVIIMCMRVRTFMLMVFLSVRGDFIEWGNACRCSIHQSTYISSTVSHSISAVSQTIYTVFHSLSTVSHSRLYILYFTVPPLYGGRMVCKKETGGIFVNVSDWTPTAALMNPNALLPWLDSVYLRTCVFADWHACPTWLPVIFLWVLSDGLMTFRWPASLARAAEAHIISWHTSNIHAPRLRAFQGNYWNEERGLFYKNALILIRSDCLDVWPYLLHGRGPLNCLDHKMLLWTKWKCRAICFTACGPSAVEYHLLKSSRFNVT